MPPVLAVLFWAWLVLSLVILLRRRAAKRAAAGEARADVDHEDLAATTAIAPEEAHEAPVTASVGATARSTGEPIIPPPGFEPTVAPVIPRPAPRSAPAAGIADALVGIQMPCDLVPLVLNRLATDRITLSTTGYPAETVGIALADEVERLGYVVRPLSPREVLATRGATDLRMTIRPPGPDGRHPEHPTARDESVVVEISLG